MILHSSLNGLDGVVIDPHRNDVRGSDTKDIRREVLHDLLSPFWKRLNASSRPNEARFPDRQGIINHTGHAPVTKRRPILLGGDDIEPATIDHILRSIVPRANR